MSRMIEARSIARRFGKLSVPCWFASVSFIAVCLLHSVLEIQADPRLALRGNEFRPHPNQSLQVDISNDRSYAADSGKISGQKSPKPAGAPAVAVPTSLTGNPDYLVRPVYFVPADRQLDYVNTAGCPGPDCPLYTSKIDDASSRIRTAVETISDFYASQMEVLGVSNPGKTLNFERDSGGNVRVLVINGTLPTQGAGGYWGNATGFDDNAIYSSVASDFLGDDAAQLAATQKTVFVIFPDTYYFDTSTSPTTVRGYLGLGGSLNCSSSGWGGISMMSAGVLEFIPPDPGSKPGRITALSNTLCDTTTTFTINGNTGQYVGAPPADFTIRPLYLGELCSLFLGVLAHETFHGFGHIHDFLGDGTYDRLMGAGYPRIGETIREMYALPPCPAIPLTLPPYLHKTGLGEPFAVAASLCPYFNPIADPDKTDPVVAFAYPPNGAFIQVPPGHEADPYPFKLHGADAGAIKVGYFYNHLLVPDFDGPLNMRDWSYYQPNGITTLNYLPFYDSLHGQNIYDVISLDDAGNFNLSQIFVFGRLDAGAYLNTINNLAVFVRRPPSEDNGPRDITAALGSYLNPYARIQDAIDYAATLGSLKSSVLVMDGVYPTTSSLILPEGVNFAGSTVGGVVLDAQGANLDLILDSAGELSRSTISNLTFRNARSGILKTSITNTHGLTVVNCIFYNLSGPAISFSHLFGANSFSQNTISHCGSGLLLSDDFYTSPCVRFTLQNNIVANCSGVGIQLDNIDNLRTQGRCGWNNCYGNGLDFAGNGDQLLGGSYASTRLVGEISAPPQFIGSFPYSSPYDLRLVPGSPSTHAGDPWTENANTSRRDMGALIDTPDLPTPTPGPNNVANWNAYE